MKYVGEMKSMLKENAYVARAAYGKGFWTLMVGLMLAVSLICQMEFIRARPVVERIPAAEVSDTIK